MEDKNKKNKNISSESSDKNKTMTHQEAGRLGGQAKHEHGMSREEAGHKGGSAAHSCRGAECHKKQ